MELNRKKKQAKLWQRRRARVEQAHVWRARRARYGELVQWDTREHDWLEGRGEKLYLIAMIDAATSELTAGFVRHDSTEENLKQLRSYIEQHGRRRFTKESKGIQTSEILEGPTPALLIRTKRYRPRPTHRASCPFSR